jgi:peptidase E
MPASAPTIIATSIGFDSGVGGQNDWVAGPAYRYAADLTSNPASPRLCIIATAGGDNPQELVSLYSAFGRLGMVVSHLGLFSQPNYADVSAHLLSQDIIWVSGGSTPNLLAVWRVHGLEQILRRCWESGVVLMGCSAGSVCWHVGGTTDGLGLPLRPVLDGLAFLPYSNSPHYDGEPERRPAFHKLIGSKTLPDGYATDNGVGLVFRGTELAEAITEVAGANAYRVEWAGAGAVSEVAITPRLIKPLVTR